MFVAIVGCWGGGCRGGLGGRRIILYLLRLLLRSGRLALLGLFLLPLLLSCIGSEGGLLCEEGDIIIVWRVACVDVMLPMILCCGGIIYF